MREKRIVVRVRVPPDDVDDFWKWAKEEYPYQPESRQLQILIANLLCDALRRRRHSVIVKNFRQRRKDS